VLPHAEAVAESVEDSILVKFKRSQLGVQQMKPIRRRFVRVNGQGVHFLRAGVGPPVVLLHPGMASAFAELPLLQHLVSDHTVFAFDHPGMGDSDPLPHRAADVADAADALNATLKALKIPRCPVYGSHTGSTIALELAHRYPSRVAALILAGLPLFRPAEAKYLAGEHYLPAFEVEDDGSHLFSTWVKTRDSAMWFPWAKRTRRHRLQWAFPSAEAVHGNFVERLRAGDSYHVVYGAVFKFDAYPALAALRTPTTIMAPPADLLFPHLDRLPALKPNQRIFRGGSDRAVYAEEKASIVRSYRVRADAPEDAPFRPTRGAINRRYVDFPHSQVLVRSAGEAHGGRPVLLLHDGRASSRTLEPLMRPLAKHRAVYALDLPDNGASDPLTVQRPRINDYADAVAETVSTLGLAACDIYAMGAGAAVALELQRRPKWAKAHLLLDAPDFYSPSFARRLAGTWVPPLKPQWDGSHLNRLWLMLRDEYAFWPWFDKSAAAQCACDTPDDWREFHARVADIIRSLPTYHRLTAAALRYDWKVVLRRTGKRVTLAASAEDPRRPHTEMAAKAADLRDVVDLPTANEAKAREVLNLLRGN
jgi:pimeloyl-ACP methyl ester carboxylesterase